jgi:hypothetical protein
MRSEMRTYWRDPDFWRWWWQSRISRQAKAALTVIVAAAFALGGYVSASQLAASEEVATFETQRVVTVVRRTPVNAPPEVVTKWQTVTQPGTTVTVRRDGRVNQRVVPRTRTETVVRIQKVTRLTTVTTPARVRTIIRKVTQPARTRTVTQTSTEAVTVTETVTETCRRGKC